MTESNNPLISRAASIMRDLSEATIATVDEAGFPSASAISSIRTAGVKDVWFATGLNSGKVKRLLKNNKCSVCYCDGKNNVTLQGTAEILTDPDIKKELWVDWFINHFPGGAEDANYCILKFAAKNVTLWVDSETAEFELGNN
jgi:general stress protein 26